MKTILLATDAPYIAEEVSSALTDSQTEVLIVESGAEVRAAIAEHQPSLVILDYQIGSMGGIAVAFDTHLEQDMARLPAAPILVLCDRRADVFLAKRAQVDGFIVKPLDAVKLRAAARALLSGGTYVDNSGEPETVSLVNTK